MTSGTPPPASGWLVVTASGELDMYSAPALRDSLLKAVNAGQTRVLLDLTKVTFIDSSGFAVLVSALKRLHALGGDLRLAGAGPVVRSAMRVGGIDQLFHLDPDVELATADDGGTVVRRDEVQT